MVDLRLFSQNFSQKLMSGCIEIIDSKFSSKIIADIFVKF